MDKTLVLDARQVDEIITRISYQILEDCYNQDELVLVGIKNRGYLLAELLQERLKKLSSKKVQLFDLQIDKKNPEQEKPVMDKKINSFASLPIILVDDVANSGRTIFYALRCFTDALFSKVRLAVLVDRKHKAFPASPDFVGYSLSTTLQNHIAVEMNKDGAFNVWLS